MLKVPLRFIILLLPLVFFGCVSVDERMQGYLGQHYSRVVAIWGAPETEVDDGEGGKLMTWRFETTYTTPATVRTTTSHDNDTYTQGNSHTHGHSHDQHGGHQAIPHHGSNYHGNTQGKQVSTTVYTPESTTTNTYTRSFYTDADGYIYDYAWQGWHPGY